MQNKNDPKTNDRQNLLGDLESIQRLLHEDTADGQHSSSEKIPILLDAVPTVPVLKEVVEEPAAHHKTSEHKTAAPTATTSSNHTAAQPVTGAAESQLALEGEQLIENLLEEYLPMIETRLREQLRLRLNFIIKEQMRKYR